MAEREIQTPDPWDLKPVLASLRTGQISDRKAMELIVEWSSGLQFSKFAPAVEVEDDDLATAGEHEWMNGNGRFVVHWLYGQWTFSNVVLVDRKPMRIHHAHGYLNDAAAEIARLKGLVPPGEEPES